MKTNSNYQLLDSGDGHLMEQWGNNIIVRPESTALWQPMQSLEYWRARADAVCTKDLDGKFVWEKSKSMPDAWAFEYNGLVAELHFSRSKNIGIFPEQELHWDWITKKIAAAIAKIKKQRQADKNAPFVQMPAPKAPRVLNLFGYTGFASLVAAKAGAEVCHLDASQAAISWARRNRDLNRFEEAPIRWIVDDAISFLQREIKREARYDAIILDPPAFGKSTTSSGKTKIFKFDHDIQKLLDLCAQVLTPEPLFVILNCYAMGYSPIVPANLLADAFPTSRIEAGELTLRETSRKRDISCSVFARLG